MNLDTHFVERRNDGALIVRVASRDRGPETLPDAMFSFRLGDPQYQFWEQVWLRRQAVAMGTAGAQ
jgi:hypothetical protein